MNFRVYISTNFRKEAKRLFKKYPSLKTDLAALISNLKTDPHQGVLIFKNIYKIRMAISSKGRGKSGGARIITFLQIIDERISLISIYNKGEKDSISDVEIRRLVEEYMHE